MSARERAFDFLERVDPNLGVALTACAWLIRRFKGTLPGLSETVGLGFSTNGDYLAFLDQTKERINLSRGPVTTSFAHFNTPDAGPGAGDPARFVMIEDNGIPRALAALAGQGVPLFKSLSKGRHTRLFIRWAITLFLLKRVLGFLPALFRNYRDRQDRFASEDEFTANLMCIAAMGRESAIGRFRLGGFGETPLRVGREDGSDFTDDEIYNEIRKRLDQFAERLTDKPDNRFINPFVGAPAAAFNAKSIGLSHPLGGCRMAGSSQDGVCDEFGRVFDSTGSDANTVYPGVYIADGARIPTALGVNPSLTIAALRYAPRTPSSKRSEPRPGRTPKHQGERRADRRSVWRRSGAALNRFARS